MNSIFAGLLTRMRAQAVGTMEHPPYERSLRELVRNSHDPVRIESILVALARLEKENIAGAIAEVGVYRGVVSEVLHRAAPARQLYLFDTFAGFPGEPWDSRFQDTNVEMVRRRVGDSDKVIFRVGRFPETAAGLEGETFSLVVLDVDKYEATIEGLKFFYPRLAPGGFLFVHDYNNPESDWAASRALGEFLVDKAELSLELPDQWGSAVFRRIRPRGT